MSVKAATLGIAKDLPPEPGASAVPDEDARRVIDKIASDRTGVFRSSIDPATGEYLDRVYAQNKSLSEHIAADYRGRCLIELIQNGNDAHPDERQDGEIEVLLADEGPFGTVYVANRGLPFTKRQVVALSGIGESSKPPGEAIGNKGLGFRSVSQVCDAPEVYSQSEPPPTESQFGGFCFALEHGEAMDGHFDDPRVSQLAQRDLPMFSVPRWLTKQPRRVADFAERGFASAVRLVMRDQGARTDILGQFVHLMTNQSVPLLLFLERLGRMTIVVEGADRPSPDRIVLTRTERRLQGSPGRASIVDLAQQGTFLLAKRPVPESTMRKAIVAGVSANQLHSSWEEWSGEGEVAVAVRTDPGPVAPRLYTFLPMGDGADAPFHGYLNGSFFPKSSRKAIDAGIDLNRLLLEEAASLSAETVRWLAGKTAGNCRRDGIDGGTAARAAVDLLVWHEVSSLVGDNEAEALDNRDRRTDLSAMVADRVADSEGQFADTTIVPCLPAGQGMSPGVEPIAWCPPSASRSWDDDSKTFSTACLADHGSKVGIAPLWPGLGEERAERLVAFLMGHAPDEFKGRPTPTERARIAESLAMSLPQSRRPPVAKWTAFYRDLVDFMDGSPLPLAGRQVILCGDGLLRSGPSIESANQSRGTRRRRRRKGERVEASLLFPRKKDGGKDEVDDSLRVPSSLKHYFAFASEALPWHGELKRAREFLEDSLVSAYDGETLLTRISQVVNSGATRNEAVAGLRWAFAIWLRAGQGLLGRGRNYQLLVPTDSGKMIPATDAVFSESWPDETLGKRLKQFIDAAPPGTTDIADLAQRRLAPTSHRAFRETRIDEWVTFLTSLGVNRGLFALGKEVRADRWFKAHELTSFTFCTELAIPKATAERWKDDISRFDPRGTRLAYTTNYSIKGPLWCLPGQGDHASFSDDCRQLYAALVVNWLGHAPEAVFSVRIEHQHRRSDQRVWPTPLLAFLRGDKWMPAEDPGAYGVARGHFAPHEVWVSGTSGERFPYYLRRPVVELANAIDRMGDGARKRLIDRSRLRVLGDPATLLEQAQFLADQFRSGSVKYHYEPQFTNLYSSTWRAVADQFAADPDRVATVTPPERLVVKRGSELQLVKPGSTDGPIWVRDNDDEIAPDIIGATGAALLEIKASNPARIGAMFDALYGDRVGRISQLRYDVRADGVPINDLSPTSTVVEVCAWLRPMLALTIEALKGTEAGQLPADRSEILSRLNGVEVQFAADVRIELDGVVIQARRPSHLFQRSDATPLVLVEHNGPIDWKIIEDCLPPICQAVNLPQVTPNMRLLARELAEAGIGVADEEQIERSGVERLGQTLALDEHALRAALSLLLDVFSVNRPWVRTVVHLVGGEEGLDILDREFGASDDLVLLRKVLEPLLAPAGISSEELVDACRRSSQVGDFREQLGFPLAVFNESLIATGHEPETYPELHANQILHFVTNHEIEIIQALRNAVAEELGRYVAAPKYVTRRDEIRSIAPDGEWLLVHKYVPDELIAAHVEAWLSQAGAPPLGQNPNGLPSLHAVRRANLATIAKFADVAAPLVRTWCLSRGHEVPELWANHSEPASKLRPMLEAAGTIDFREVDNDGLLRWCVALNAWPSGMERTLDRAVLGIHVTDVEVANEKVRVEAERREAERRSVEFNGDVVDPHTADWTEISSAIGEGLAQTIKGMALGTPADLASVSVRTKGPGGGPHGIPSSKRTVHIPQAKKDMIGRLGELIVYHWLKGRFPNQDIDAAWVSQNGNDQLGRSGGSDGLGFDFEIEYRNQTWQIEVKASVGDQQRFEMGESEVRAAREAARPRSGTRYVVVYVANPHDPANAHIDVLPNPMSPEADGVLDLLGEGVRFGFRRRLVFSP